MNTNKTFKLVDITKLFNIKRHFVIHLVEKRIIQPLQDARGRGKSRTYSYRNLIEIGIFIYLNKLELSYKIAREILLSIKALESSRLERISYISVIGLINGDYFLSVRSARGSKAKTISPEECLILDIKGKLSDGKDNKKEGFAYYFIIDVKNIIAFVNERISQV